MSFPVSFRPAIDNDLPFVFTHWRKSYRDSDFGYTLTGDVYASLQIAKMNAAIETANVVVAFYNNDPDHLIGFIVHSRNPADLTVVSYAYVRWEYRKEGIAQRMLAHINPSVPVAFIDVTDKFFMLRQMHDLPYITARELDDFTNQNPENPMKAFSRWFRDQVHRNAKARDRLDAKHGAKKPEQRKAE